MIVVVGMAAAILLGSVPHDAGASSTDFTHSLLTLSDMPTGWKDFKVTYPSRVAKLCGSPAPQEDLKASAGAAFTLNPKTGPYFGERIEPVGSDAAEHVLQDLKALHLPCTWHEVGRTWHGSRPARTKLSDDYFVIEIVNGTSTFSNYEAVVRRRGVLIVIAFGSDPHDPSSFVRLVKLAVKRFDARQSSQRPSSTEAPRPRMAVNRGHPTRRRPRLRQ